MSSVVEIIADEDDVHRLIDFPTMYEESKGLVWELIFQLPSPDLCESVVWNKYAPTSESVHHLGLEREAKKRLTKPTMRYIGFITAAVGAIRAIRTRPGHGFSVVHKPAEGVHHAEISYLPAGGADLGTLRKDEKNELKLALRQVFSALNKYAPPA